MGKRFLRGVQMGQSVVGQAREWANMLVHSQCRGPGDFDNAMRRVETKWGIPYGLIWSLRYRPPKDVPGSLLVSLFAAVEDLRETGRKKYEHELAIAQATGRSNSILARMAVALAGEPAGQNSTPD